MLISTLFRSFHFLHFMIHPLKTQEFLLNLTTIHICMLIKFPLIVCVRDCACINRKCINASYLMFSVHHCIHILRSRDVSKDSLLSVNNQWITWVHYYSMKICIIKNITIMHYLFYFLCLRHFCIYLEVYSLTSFSVARQ